MTLWGGAYAERALSRVVTVKQGGQNHAAQAYHCTSDRRRPRGDDVGGVGLSAGRRGGFGWGRHAGWGGGWNRGVGARMGLGRSGLGTGSRRARLWRRHIPTTRNYGYTATAIRRTPPRTPPDMAVAGKARLKLSALLGVALKPIRGPASAPVPDFLSRRASGLWRRPHEFPPLSTVTARRFCDQQEMSSHTATGRSLPKLVVRMREAETPREAR